MHYRSCDANSRRDDINYQRSDRLFQSGEASWQVYDSYFGIRDADFSRPGAYLGRNYRNKTRPPRGEGPLTLACIALPERVCHALAELSRRLRVLSRDDAVVDLDMGYER